MRKSTRSRRIPVFLMACVAAITLSATAACGSEEETPAPPDSVTVVPELGVLSGLAVKVDNGFRCDPDLAVVELKTDGTVSYNGVRITTTFDTNHVVVSAKKSDGSAASMENTIGVIVADSEAKQQVGALTDNDRLSSNLRLNVADWGAIDKVTLCKK